VLTRVGRHRLNVVTIKVINYGAHPVQIKAAGIDFDGQSIQVVHANGDSGETRAARLGHDMAAQELAELTAVEIGWVRVGTDDSYRSGPYQLSQRQRESP
jgi:hypothetical protein